MPRQPPYSSERHVPRCPPPRSGPHRGLSPSPRRSRAPPRPYVTGLVACPQDAQDVMQEGKIIMWRQFHQFERPPISRPGPKSSSIRSSRIAAARSATVPNTSATGSSNCSARNPKPRSASNAGSAARKGALQECVTKLSPEHREILELRYRDEASIEGISRRTERTEGAVYRLLGRLRKNLDLCVEKELGTA